MRSAVITLVAGRHSHLALQRRGLLAGGRQPDLHIVVSMNDPRAAEGLDRRAPCPDVIELSYAPGPLPLARARNTGAQHALRAGADLLIFLDVDCIPGPLLVQRYLQVAAGEPDPTVLCGPVAYLPPPPADGYQLSALAELGRPHPARPVPPETGTQSGGDHTLFWSLSFAVRAKLWRELGGFCEQYSGYGGEDTDFGQLAARHQTALTWVGGAWAYHQHHPSANPPVQHVGDIIRNASVFYRRWGWWPMTGWLDEFERRGLIVFDRRTQTWQAVSP
ncbi:MAG: glycosyltransferase family 2 protein [Actinomycetota bacterium]|nr:glycosyltransferase family 2 protein [Actinomycetota bacterium]